MAVDTAQKRASISSGLPWEANGWPDSTVGAEDRAQLAGLYAGLDYMLAPVGGVPDVTLSAAATPRLALVGAASTVFVLEAAATSRLVIDGSAP